MTTARLGTLLSGLAAFLSYVADGVLLGMILAVRRTPETQSCWLTAFGRPA